jgi:hypothetical protein
VKKFNLDCPVGSFDRHFGAAADHPAEPRGVAAPNEHRRSDREILTDLGERAAARHIEQPCR